MALDRHVEQEKWEVVQEWKFEESGTRISFVIFMFLEDIESF